MIYSSLPVDWRDLQGKVAQVFRDLRFETEVEKNVDLVRGGAEIDVYAVDETQYPNTVYVCECKNWSTRIPQNVVHGFRTVVTDAGAHHGLLISKEGFQSGSYTAARQTNIRLLNWAEFQAMFADRWYRNHMLPSLREERLPLTPFVELINSSIERRARKRLDPNQQETYRHLRKQYEDIELLALSLEEVKPDLPLTKYVLSDRDWELLSQEGQLDNVPPFITALRELSGYNDILEARALRDLLDALTFHLRRGTQALEELFGKEDR